MQVEKQLTFGRDARVRLALTLVELLVTVSIMGLIIAVSIPVVRPMLASNKVKSGADMVAGFLAQARNRAIEEGRPVGVTFERVLNYEDNGAYPYNGASVLMRQVAEPKPLSGFVKDVRVAVDCRPLNGTGHIYFCDWNGSGWNCANSVINIPNHAEWPYWSKLINAGDQIQFDGKGPKYEISEDKTSVPGKTLYKIDMNLSTNWNLPAPNHFDSNFVPIPAMFKVFRKPQPGKIAPTMATPVALPEGVVVDLDSSGMGQTLYDPQGNLITNPSQNYPVIRDIFTADGRGDIKSVTIMFSAIGEVDRVYFSEQGTINYNDPNSKGRIYSDIPSGPIYLCVGIWERSGFWMQDDSDKWYVSNDYLPDEAEVTRNYQDMNNYWVTLFPRTGTTRVNRVANVTSRNSGMLTESRKLADSLHGSESL